MVKFNNSTWLVRRRLSVGGNKSGLFLLFILLTAGIFNSPIASSKMEPLPNIQTIRLEIQSDMPKVETAGLVPASSNNKPQLKEQEPADVFLTQNLGLQIDAIGINVPLVETTLGKNRELLVPANPDAAAWYKSGPKPGEPGSALITGHLDSPAGPGVFYNLRRLEPNDVIEVRRDDGKVATFKIDKLDSYRQDQTFPWNLVYSTTGASGLRLITCDGVYNPITQKYSHNLVVFASLVSIS